MPSAKLQSGSAGIIDWLSYVFAKTDCVVFETYSRFDSELRRFSSLHEFLAAYPLNGAESSPLQFSLWSPSVMPEPSLKRIELKAKDHEFRYSVQGCGLFSFLIAAAKNNGLRKWELNYWSEAGAYQRCTVEPSPSLVNWLAHKRLGASLVRYAKSVSNAL